MEHDEAVQTALDYIDEVLTEPLSVAKIAGQVGYSPYHFSRSFSQAVGMPVMAYVTWRRLQFAQHALSQGGKVIDAAVEYGFDTHAGFTKAFKRCFGYPPSLCFLRVNTPQPDRATPEALKRRFGGTAMTPHILELSPFSVVGYPERHKAPHVKNTADVPSYWNTIKMDCGSLLTKLHETFPHSKHFEVCMCYDVDEAAGEFTYLMGRGIDNPEDLANMV